jgi:hypothetical protein
MRLNALKVSDGSPTAFAVSMKQPPIPVLRAPIVLTAVMHASVQDAESAEDVIGKTIVLQDALKPEGYHGISTSTIIGEQLGLYLAGWDSAKVRMSGRTSNDVRPKYRGIASRGWAPG